MFNDVENVRVEAKDVETGDTRGQRTGSIFASSRVSLKMDTTSAIIIERSGGEFPFYVTNLRVQDPANLG